mgnify:CR=1 FL=1
MGTSQSTPHKINFEDIQVSIKNNNKYIINTLPITEQNCLISKTINHKLEEKFINDNLKNLSCSFIIYGKNCNDESIYKKYTQLINLGFTNVFIYTGGLFEWLCLQDIYGPEEFPTTSIENDILKYKAPTILTQMNLLTN